MRLTLVIWSLEAGGAQRVIVTLADKWADQHDTTLVTLSRETADHFLPSESVERVRLSFYPRRSQLGALFRKAAALTQLRSVIKRSRPDVVLSFIDRTNNQVLLATRGLGVHVVVSERVDPRYYKIPLKARILRRLVYPRADGIVVQTEALRPWCEGFVEPAKAWVIPNPVRPCVAERVVRSPVVVGMGRLVPQKGFDVLLDAFARVAPRFSDWNIVILGEGPERPALLDQARRLGLAERVSLPGVVPDPSPYLAGAGLFVLSSRYEGFPNVLLEAMSCGVASISTDCPSGPSDIITDGVDGVLVPVDDVAGMASALERLIADRALRERLGKRANQSVQRFSMPDVLKKWEEVIEAVHSAAKP